MLDINLALIAFKTDILFYPFLDFSAIVDSSFLDLTERKRNKKPMIMVPRAGYISSLDKVLSRLFQILSAISFAVVSRFGETGVVLLL